jgi:hypothetical protein
MRQSRKESQIQRAARQGYAADRREALVFQESVRTEFADEGSGGFPSGTGNGRRPSPGVRG